MNADGSQLYDVSVHGSKPRLLTVPFRNPRGYPDDHMMRGPHTLVFSPNGNYLLLVRGIGRFDTENKRLALLTYPAGKQKWLTGPNVAATWPVWSPDGKRIAYLACPDTKPMGDGDDIQRRKAHRHLWITDTDGYHQHQLTSDTHYQELAPRWLPGGRIIRFTRQENTPDGDGKTSQWEINAEGTGLHRIDFTKAETGDRTWTASR